MSSLALGRELEHELSWLAGLFTAAELAATDLLLRLSGENDAAASTSTTPSSSPHRVSPCRKDFEAEPAVSTELDRRARKRYRPLSDLYAATSMVTSAAAASKKRKTCGDDDDDDEGVESESWSEDATRQGDSGD